ncbi:MAG TPA: adenylate/guanylate cyclase domain-containing protein [bacterium]|nr:adenylate/guanylate cyclase domain-containing protein [bacterium]
MTEIPENLHIDPQELTLIDGFRQSRNTSVLTIMFTDIQGFTRLTEERGDAYSNEVRRTHDGILGPIIERGGAGRIIKHIGDAVMAVFSEPSTAVARALEIQEALRRYNDSRPGEPPLLVRIGLHMGQVTVEDKTDLDVFGRHVNRASRVEGLAEGGHIYMTYSVFDSAKGWMAGRKQEADWADHGSYQVKGIDEPLEIYEAYKPGGIEPQRPKGGRRRSDMPHLLPALGLVLAGALGVLAFLFFHGPTVNFEDLGVRTDTTDVILDHKTRLQFEGQPGDHLRRCLTKIGPGRHLIHYDVSYITRYYSPITVAWGTNILKPHFEYFGMPGLEAQMGFEPKGKNERTFTNSTDYATYDDTLERHDHRAILTLSLKAASGDGAPAAAGVKPHRTLDWTLEWTVAVDSAVVSSDKLMVEHDPAAAEPTEGKRELWGDARHKYVLSYRLSDTYAQAGIQAQYSEYK